MIIVGKSTLSEVSDVASLDYNEVIKKGTVYIKQYDSTLLVGIGKIVVHTTYILSDEYHFYGIILVIKYGT